MAKTTNTTAKILAEINQEMGELRMTILQNRATTDFLLLKHNLRCQQFPGMYYFYVSYFFHTIDNQISDLWRERNSPRNRMISPPD